MLYESTTALHRMPCTGLTPPGYFPKNVLMNIKGYERFEDVLHRGTTAFSANEFDQLIHEAKVLVLDARDPAAFKNGFIPGSWNIGLSGSFAVWAGTLIKDIKQPILLVADPGKEQEAVTRLARVGYDHCRGYLEGGFQAWKNAGLKTDRIRYVTASQLASINETGAVNILDVRKKSEFDSEHIVGAINAPLDYIETSAKSLRKTDTYYVHCAGGYRSMIFASILQAQGFGNLVDVEGGFAAIKETGRFDISEYVCPTTML